MNLMCCNTIVATVLLIVLSTQSIFTNATLYSSILRSDGDFNENLVVKAVMNIVETCFSHALDMVVFAGDFRNFSLWHKNFPPPLTMYRITLSEYRLFQRHRRLQGVYKLNEITVSKLRYPAKIFMISSLVPFRLKLILKRLRKSVLWNARAFFFLIDNNPESQCGNADDALAKAWQYNILHVVYVCLSANGIVEYYTINPFTNMSSEAWELVDVVNSTNGHGDYPMNVFKLTSDLNASYPSICNDFSFDKDLLVNGYPIRMCAQIKSEMFVPLNNDTSLHSANNSITFPLTDFGGLDANVFKIIWSRLKAAPEVTIYDSRGFLDEHSNPRGLIYELMEYAFDAGANEHYRRSFWRLETYPHDITSMCAMTKRKVQESTTKVVFVVLEPSVLGFIALMSGLFILFLRRLLKTSYVNSSLELLRTLLGMSTQEEPKMPYGRPLFTYVILLTFYMNLYFGSKLTSSFAIKTKDRNINTAEDLTASNYRLMGEGTFNEFLDNAILRYRFNESKLEECLEVLPWENVACLCDCYEANYYAMDKDNVHVSQPLYDTYVTYIVREDWPLLNRVNDIMQRMREGGIIIYEDERIFYDVDARYKARKVELKNNDESEFQGKPFPIQRLTYNCYLYVAGMAVAFVIFLGEVLVKCYN